jgi:hypothetical protein
MARPIRSIEIYLPLDFNDGKPIPGSNYVSIQQELLNRFGGVTSVQRHFPLQGPGSPAQRSIMTAWWCSASWISALRHNWSACAILSG